MKTKIRKQVHAPKPRFTEQEDTIILQLFAKGLTYKEIGRQINRPAGSVGTTLSRLRKTQRENEYFNVDQHDNWLI